MSLRLLCACLLLALAPFGPAAASAEGDGGGSSAYLPLQPAFVVNVNDGEEVHHMQVDIQVKLAGPEAAGLIEEHMPAIRHSLVLLLSGQEVKTVRTVQGKEKLRQEALEAVQKVLEENAGTKGIEALYFTGLIIQ